MGPRFYPVTFCELYSNVDLASPSSRAPKLITPRRLRFGRVGWSVCATSLQGTFSCIAPGGSGVEDAEVKKRMRTRKSRPSKRKLGIKLHRPLIKTHGFQTGIGVAKGEVEACFERQAAQICMVGFRIVCRLNCVSACSSRLVSLACSDSAIPLAISLSTPKMSVNFRS